MTASTIASRRDELDLFVRHLFNLPRAVTTYPLVKAFFSVKNNGLDGLSPPSPTPCQQALFDASRPEESSKLPTAQDSPSRESLPRTFRPVLGAKRSTPDLRRFISSSQAQEDEFTSFSPSTAPYPSHLNFRFPRSATSSTIGSTATSTDADTLRPSISMHMLNTPISPRSQSRVGLANDTFDLPVSPGGSDGSSMKTASTIKPNRSGSFSRISSPLSFLSDEGDAVHRSAKPVPGALRHFRSLQVRRSCALFPPMSCKAQMCFV